MQAGQTGFKRRGHYLFRSFFPTSRQGSVCRLLALCVILVFTFGRPATFIPGNTANVNTDGIIDPNCAALGGAPTSSNKRCRFQYTPFDNLVEKTRRWQSFTEASWELSDAVTLSTEFLYSESRVPDWNTSPLYPPNRVIDSERSLRANNPALDPESAVSFNVGLLLDHDDLLADNDGLSMPVKT